MPMKVAKGIAKYAVKTALKDIIGTEVKLS